jgi:hypothetical protein
MSNWMFMGLFPGEKDLEYHAAFLTEKKLVRSLGRKNVSFDEKGGVVAMLEKLLLEHPISLMNSAKAVADRYNGFVNEATGKYPLTVDAYWQVYRRILCKGSMGYFPDNTKTDAENDNMMSLHYLTLIASLSGIMESSKELDLKSEPSYALVNVQAKPSAMFKSFTFQDDKTKEIVQSLFDLRERNIQLINPAS